MGFIKENQKTKTKNKQFRKVYILHGWTYKTSRWRPFLEELKKNGVEGIMIKIPGLTAPLKKTWTLNDYISWFHKHIKDKRGITILGHSNGGRIALSYALNHPENIKQLILIDSAGIYHKEIKIRFKRIIFKALSSLGKKIAPGNLRPLLYKLAKEHDYEKADPVLRKTMQNLISVDLMFELCKIAVPTIIIWGGKDKVTPFNDALIMHKFIKNSKLFLIKEAEHSPQFTHVSKVAEIVLKSLTK